MRSVDNEIMINHITKIVKKGDYLYAVVKGHPMATKNNYVLLHRALVENHLGRYLTREEVVHHKDGNKKNNSIDNLQVMSAKSHGLLHKKPRKYVKLLCPGCGVIFDRPYNKTHLYREGRATFCSKVCGGRGVILYHGNVLNTYYK